MRNRGRLALALTVIVFLATGCATRASRTPDIVASPGEFEPQEYIWLTWREDNFLGRGATFADVALDVMKEITPHVRVRLMYSDETPPYRLSAADATRSSPDAAKARIEERLRRAGVDLAKVEFIYTPRVFGALQDPGPQFLRTADGTLAVADYNFDHPDPQAEAIDREAAAMLGMPTIRSALSSEGGARQSNGEGVLMLVRKVEQDRNPAMPIEDIEREHLRVQGASKVIWLEAGPADEEWGRLADGKWAIGTGGHVDVFARFVDAGTIILAEVSPEQRAAFPILAQTHARMERNLAILRAATDQDGKPFTILRAPVPDPLTASVAYDALSADEQSWFEGAAPGDMVEYYMPAGYLNFIIANDVVVTAKLGVEGRPQAFRAADERARAALAAAFPGRRIAMVDATPLLHDGGGLHCHSRNQPFAARPQLPARWLRTQ